MIDSAHAVTLRTSLLALDAAMLRQQAHAANIANASHTGYQPATVDFDSQLMRARTDMLVQGSISMDSLAGVQPVLLRRPPSGSVQVDAEVAGMAQTSVVYQSVSTALSRYLSIMAMAVADGRR